jgi:hypothetical protein
MDSSSLAFILSHLVRSSEVPPTLAIHPGLVLHASPRPPVHALGGGISLTMRMSGSSALYTTGVFSGVGVPARHRLISSRRLLILSFFEIVITLHCTASYPHFRVSMLCENDRTRGLRVRIQSGGCLRRCSRLVLGGCRGVWLSKSKL